MSSAHRYSPSRTTHVESSSPDPLADSFEFYEGRTRARPAPDRELQGVLKGAKPNAEFNLSPSKMIAEQNLSPWRIKVTVEAQPEDNAQSEGCAGRRQTITRTMKVPLRNSSPPSNMTSCNNKNTKKTSRKSASPARTRSRRQSVTDLDIVVLGDDGEDDVWTGKPQSPRKRRNSRSKTLQKTTSSRRSSSAQFEIREDRCAAEQEQVNTHKDTTPEMKELNLNEVNTRTRPSALTKSIPKEKQGIRTSSINSAISYPTPSPTASEHARSDDGVAVTEQDEQPIGLDTVVESEGFTMIDLDTIPSIRQIRNSPDYPSIPEAIEEESQSTLAASHETQEVCEAPSIAITNDDSGVSELDSSPPSLGNIGKSKKYSIGHLQLPSSTNIQRHRLVTPMPVAVDPYSSPKLPSPPRATFSSTRDRSPIHSDSAVEASSALLDAVAVPAIPVPIHNVDSNNIAEEQSLFGHFSSSTRRELRAELRFGEELANKQVPTGQDQPQVRSLFNGNTTTHCKPIDAESLSEFSSAPHIRSKEVLEDAFERSKARIENEKEQERRVIAAQAKSDNTITIDDDDESEQRAFEQEDPDETMGDIWLAEAQQPSSSPKEESSKSIAPKATFNPPRRKLIPSPWTRGERTEASHISDDESFSGLFWKQRSLEDNGNRFGEAIVAHPEKSSRKVSSSDRRRSGVYDVQNMMIRTPQRTSQRQDVSNDVEPALEEEDLDAHNNDLLWRSAADVVEEETASLEAERTHWISDRGDGDIQEAGATKLYETNLDDIPEQDLASTPNLSQANTAQHLQYDHDSTYSSISADSAEELYCQRTSLSPSKERPNTPRSAMKGTRASFGVALNYDADSDTNAKKVVWARRSKCVNELWEESTQSVRSSQTANDGSSLVLNEHQTMAVNPEPSFEVNPQPITSTSGDAGWFGWFKTQRIPTSSSDMEARPVLKVNAIETHGFDGAMDNDDNNDGQGEILSGYKPTSRHEPELKPKEWKSCTGHETKASVKHEATSVQTPTTRNTTPSYLLPPSYPSDPSREAASPLASSGEFSNTHFRTLNIIYKKSSRARFHAPAYPTEIRHEITQLVGTWKMHIDESRTMGEDGLFDFSIGATEARVLERFMREVEHSQHEAGANEVIWQWTAEELAHKLGRIAIGEIMREEEKAAKKILEAV